MKNNKTVVKAEIIELKDEYLEIKAIKNQSINKIKKNKGLTPRIKPNRHATPFPPLNFNQTGNICPIIENKPHNAPIFFS